MSAPSATDGGVHNLAKKAEWDDAIKQPGLVVLDCFATWCGPCKVIAPKIVEYVSSRFTLPSLSPQPHNILMNWFS